MIGIFKVKRTKDNAVLTKETEFKSLKDATFGYDLMLKQGLFKGYEVTDKETKEVLVSKGDI